ncbi:tRNA1(Val) (adenine(37)-N6)-methyltransferase [Bacteroidia bacterium]|nr:tRNA1(Val) (adenine(37)-N6)-methyltransferase [Bacteroidia bacterium]
MKVGTDGVLLGAWTDHSDAKTILDAGTGSGLIALMLAQRSDAQIDAIDIDENACRQAEINFRLSPFASRLHICQGNFVEYTSGYTYDLIVSNPPYFKDSLKSPDSGRNAARHTDTLSYSDLFQKSSALLSEKGRLSVILPVDIFENMQHIADANDFYLIRKTTVRPLENHPPKRVLLEFSKEKSELKENEIFIEKSRHVYSDEYIELTKAYYLERHSGFSIVKSSDFN